MHEHKNTSPGIESPLALIHDITAEHHAYTINAQEAIVFYESGKVVFNNNVVASGPLGNLCTEKCTWDCTQEKFECSGGVKSTFILPAQQQGP